MPRVYMYVFGCKLHGTLHVHHQYDNFLNENHIRAQLHIQASMAIKLGNEKLDQLQKNQRKAGDQENMMVLSANVDHAGKY